MVLRKEGDRAHDRPTDVERPAVIRARPDAAVPTPRLSTSLSRMTGRDAESVHAGYPHWQGVVPLPPEGLMWAAGAPSVENFLVVADAWAQMARRHLPPGGVLLDAGCGCGRLARAFVADATLGGYVGFDCMAASIAWCERYLAPAFTAVRCDFHHVDARSGEYNPNGIRLAGDVTFPCPDGTMDVVVASSLFTHLLEDDAAQYLREIARVLRPSGTALVSIRALDAPATPYTGGEGCIDVDKRYFLRMAGDAGLECHDETADFVGETLLVMRPRVGAARGAPETRGDSAVVAGGRA